jgi:hypothetical protein
MTEDLRRVRWEGREKEDNKFQATLKKRRERVVWDGDLGGFEGDFGGVAEGVGRGGEGRWTRRGCCG